MQQVAWYPAALFFFNDTATTEIYTLSLHDALPIWLSGGLFIVPLESFLQQSPGEHTKGRDIAAANVLTFSARSEEHTSELQSQSNLVCRLLLEKKKRRSRMTRRCVYVSAVGSERLP